MRNKNIESLRGIAILLLLFYHFTISLNVFNDMALIYMDEAFCQFAMIIFFVISGYGTLLYYQKKEAKKESINFYTFLKRRFFKIAPAYYFCLIFILLFTKGGMFLSKGGIKSVIVYGCLVQNLFPAYSGDINGVTWTIALLLQFYLISYPLYKVVNKWGWKSYIICVFISLSINTLICEYITVKGYPNVYYVIASIRQIFTTIDIFIIGMLCGKSKKNYMIINKELSIFLSIGIFIIAICIFVKSALAIGGIWGNGIKFYLWKPCVSMTIGGIILLIRSCEFHYKSWVGKSIQLVASIEYNTYLWHMILFENLKSTSELFNVFMAKNPLITAIFLVFLALFVGFFLTIMLRVNIVKEIKVWFKDKDII